MTQHLVKHSVDECGNPLKHYSRNSKFLAKAVNKEMEDAFILPTL